MSRRSTAKSGCGLNAARSPTTSSETGRIGEVSLQERERCRTSRKNTGGRSNAINRVFDSWPILAWIEDEPAADAVEALLKERDSASSWSVINAGEVLYQLARRQGEDVALDFWTASESGRLPLRAHSATDARVRQAALIKSRFPLSYADAFAMALSIELRAPLVTGDREIRAVAKEAGIILEWIGPD
jgi:ribonuclease VapC